jgi:hypothetical protein
MKPRTKDFNRTTFGTSDRVVLRALAEALFSEDGEVPAATLDAFVIDVDGYVSPASRGLRFGLVAMLTFIRWSPILLFFAGSLFENLPVGRRVELLDRIDRSKIALVSLVLVAFRTIMTMVFYEQPDELKLLGYPGEERKTYLRLGAR